MKLGLLSLDERVSIKKTVKYNDCCSGFSCWEASGLSTSQMTHHFRSQGPIFWWHGNWRSGCFQVKNLMVRTCWSSSNAQTQKFPFLLCKLSTLSNSFMGECLWYSQCDGHDDGRKVQESAQTHGIVNTNHHPVTSCYEQGWMLPDGPLNCIYANINLIEKIVWNQDCDFCDSRFANIQLYFVSITNCLDGLGTDRCTSAISMLNFK